MLPLRQWPLLPLHAAALATGAKSFENNPLIGSARLNRWGLHMARRRIALRLAELRRRAMADYLSPDDREAFLRDGYLIKRDFLPAAAFQAMREELFAARIEAREFIDGYSLTRLIPLDAQTLPRLPATTAALEHPQYRALHDYIGSFRLQPYRFVQTIYSNFRAAEPDVQSDYHMDTFHPTVKSWLFVEDVAEEEAGFTYVPGSHMPTQRHLEWEQALSIRAAHAEDRSTREGSLRIEPEEIAALGYRTPVKFSAPANTLVIADTSGFHRRGVTDARTRRIAIWSYARGNPFRPWAGGDVLGATGLDKRAVRLFWSAQDALKRARGKTGGWRWVGERSPVDPPMEAADPA
ncbi:phytanoyl-CoA dioxygenase [Rhodovarius crocodyli]|uniref:Phytanoyl-CoA dioxygenase n=1 Tax=Rhodovarius crocodyli TaxID=1979269 RepID=A0A437LXA5_9PROT|nr:phytanoyl-CoA dioxygenase family protein [Rhodovarius crocodyli]RVT90016.1 phytanoyl-CoA dioxygenase [Rhodovarius crocodyli]